MVSQLSARVISPSPDYRPWGNRLKSKRGWERQTLSTTGKQNTRRREKARGGGRGRETEEEEEEWGGGGGRVM